MRTATYIARRRIVREWRSLLSVCLVSGIAGGLALGALVGGFRTASALDRMEAATKPYDVWVEPMTIALDPGTFDMIAALPMVTSAAGVYIATFGRPDGFRTVHELRKGELQLEIVDNGALTAFARPILTAGRMPTPDSSNEVLVQQFYADAHHLHVGDRIPVRTFSESEALTLWMIGDADVGELTSSPSFGTPHLLTVAGIGSTQDSLVTYPGAAPTPFIGGPGLKPLLTADSRDWPYGALLTLTDPTQLPALRDAMAKMLPDQVMTYQTWASSKALAERAMKPAAVVLWIFAVVVGLIGLVLVGQTLARRFPLDVGRSRALSALGVTHRERTTVVFLMMLPAVAVGGALAAAGAYATSWLTPVGPARAAEVSPGPQFELAYVVGAGLWCAAILVMSLVPAWRSTRLVADDEAPDGSRVAARLAGWGVPYPITVGMRFALEPGRGTTSMPTRSTLAGAVMGGVVLVATATFVASLGAAISQPDRYGLNFDGAILYSYHSSGTPWPPLEALERPLRSDPGVAEVGLMRIDEVVVGPSPLMALSFAGPSDIGPTVVEGRMPSSVDEVALGQVTMSQLDASVGDEVTVVAPGWKGPARIVGVVVLPSQGFYQTSDVTAPGVGAVVDGRALGAFDPNDVWLATFTTKPGASPSQVYQRVEAGADFPFEALGMDVVWPLEVQTLAGLRTLPIVLAGSLLLLMAASGTHGFFVAIRGRRRDLAVLRILGVRRGAMRGIGLSQGATIVAVAAIVGIPLGVIIGRWSWTWLATRYGLVPVPEVPAAVVVAIVGLEAVLAAASGLAAVEVGLRRSAFKVLSND